MAKVKITAKTFSIIGKDGARKVFKRGDVVDMPDNVAKRYNTFMEPVSAGTNTSTGANKK